MNRQVAPSILLSVFFVGFFAVALYRHDPVPSRRVPGDSGARGAVAASPGLRRGAEVASSAGHDPVREAASTQVGAAKRVSRETGTRTGRGSGGAFSGGEVRRLDRAPTFAEPAAVARAAGRGGRAGSETPSGSTRGATSARPQRLAYSAASGMPDEPNFNRSRSAPVQPRDAFTVVEPHETIFDVCLRVYGTTDRVESLWQANRDALPRRDSPLPPGTLLRTPRIASRARAPG
jgi:hypothetical protein